MASNECFIHGPFPDTDKCYHCELSDDEGDGDAVNVGDEQGGLSKKLRVDHGFGLDEVDSDKEDFLKCRLCGAQNSDPEVVKHHQPGRWCCDLCTPLRCRFCRAEVFDLENPGCISCGRAHQGVDVSSMPSSSGCVTVSPSASFADSPCNTPGPSRPSTPSSMPSASGCYTGAVSSTLAASPCPTPSRPGTPLSRPHTPGLSLATGLLAMNSSSDEDSDKESSDGLQELVDKVDKQNNAIVQNLATPVHGGGARHVNYVPSMAAWRRGQLVNNSPFP